MNIILWDIESTGLNADWDNILCIGWKRLGSSKVHCVDVTQFKNGHLDDKQVLRKVYPVLADADMFVTHNGIRFDVPFVNTRLLLNNLPLLPPAPHVDTYRSIARHGLRVSSRRMGALAELFELSEQKEPPGRAMWRKAKAGSRAAIKRIAKYCKQDVRTLEALYLKLRGLHNTHPNLGLLSGGGMDCPKCGLPKLQKHGTRIARTAVQQRYRCMACGGWSQAPISVSKTGKIREGRVR